MLQFRADSAGLRGVPGARMWMRECGRLIVSALLWARGCLVVSALLWVRGLLAARAFLRAHPPSSVLTNTRLHSPAF